jgi:hypothetical protein
MTVSSYRCFSIAAIFIAAVIEDSIVIQDVIL